MMDVLKSGKTKFQVGTNENLFDWTYVDNVVHAHLVAAERLALTVPLSVLAERLVPVELTIPRRQLPTSVFRPESLLAAEKELDPSFENDTKGDEPLIAARNRYDPYFPDGLEERLGLGLDADGTPGELAIAGQAFFVTNGEPVPFWDFPRALWAAYNGHVAPYVVPLPAAVGLAIAGIAETVMGWLGKTPNMTRGKIVYSTVDRYYNIEKVRPSFPPSAGTSVRHGLTQDRAGSPDPRVRAHRRRRGGHQARRRRASRSLPLSLALTRSLRLLLMLHRSLAVVQGQRGDDAAQDGGGVSGARGGSRARAGSSGADLGHRSAVHCTTCTPSTLLRVERERERERAASAQDSPRWICSLSFLRLVQR